jgi:hypothetical protein
MAASASLRVKKIAADAAIGKKIWLRGLDLNQRSRL